MPTNEHGRVFEEKFAGLIRGKVQPGSGGGYFYKLDVSGQSMLASCKATKKRSFSVTPETMAEIKYRITGPGGVGGDTIGLLAIEVEDEDGSKEWFILQHADDWVRAMTSDEIPRLQPSRHDARRRSIKTPRFLRESEDDDS